MMTESKVLIPISKDTLACELVEDQKRISNIYNDNDGNAAKQVFPRFIHKRIEF